MNVELERAVGIDAVMKKLKREGWQLPQSRFEITVELGEKYRRDRTKDITKTSDFKSDYLREELKQLNEQKDFLRDFDGCTELEDQERKILHKYRDVDKSLIFTPDQVKDRLDNVDMVTFGQMLNGNFFDNATMNSMVCLADAAYIAKSSSLAPNERIRAWIRHLRRVGAESASGMALQSDVGMLQEQAKSLFIVKAVQEARKNPELLHEAFLGLAATNHLRKLVPNFAYIYGYFECSAPVAGPLSKADPKGKVVATYCNTMDGENNVAQTIYENIAPAQAMADVIPNWDGKTFMQYYLAILMALHKAMEYCDFTHYDLHDNNVLIRECTDKRYLEAIKSGKTGGFYVGYNLVTSKKTSTYYVSSPGGIPTIIDYGRSHVKVGGKHYGMPNTLYIKQGIYINKSNPMADVYRLLGFSLLRTDETQNVSMIKEIAPLFLYFNNKVDPIQHVYDVYDKTKFIFPYETDLDDLSDYINFCIDYSERMNYGIVERTLPRGAFVLTPVSDRLEISVMEEIGLSRELVPLPRPVTILELYDVLTKYTNGYLYYKTVSKGRDLSKRYIDAYRAVRDIFASDNPRAALQTEEARLLEAVTNFAVAINLKKGTIEKQFTERKDIVPLLIENFVRVKMPEREDTYFDSTALNKVRNYVGKFALLEEMRQDFIVSVKALNYLYSAYDVAKDKHNEFQNVVDEISPLYFYLIAVLDRLEPTYLRHCDNLRVFVELFTYDKDNAKDMRWYNKLTDWSNSKNEKYLWYFNVATTLPSLFYPWEAAKKELIKL